MSARYRFIDCNSLSVRFSSGIATIAIAASSQTQSSRCGAPDDFEQELENFDVSFSFREVRAPGVESGPPQQEPVRLRVLDQDSFDVRRELRHILRVVDYRQPFTVRSEEHTSELQSLAYLVCRLLLEK